jgi:hypothetical protein
MIEYLAWAAVAIAVPAAAIVGYASRRPDVFRVSRSATIDAPPEGILPLIASPRRMNEWNPFAADPTSIGTYSGPETGPGATYAFAGRSGTGKLAVTGIDEPRRVDMRLAMTKPIACDNAIAFTLEPRGASTVVTWSMEGRNSLPSKIMGCFIDCDRMCGEQFEKGLADLKAKVEARALGA